MKTPEQMVLEFHKKYGHLVNTKPTVDLPDNVKNLRRKLIEEEWSELSKGLREDDLIEIADGIADLIYVLVGTAISYGIPIDRVLQEVHNSNLTKTASKAYEGQKYGEVNPKGPDFRRPQIWEILTYPEDPTNLELKNLRGQLDPA
jgi:predicted HAD superfamily Cof-like phosphohydrolase